MMNSDFLRSSILNREFINYKKYNGHNSKSFSIKTRFKGTGQIPVVIDSIDKQISLLLSNCDTINISRRYWTYGGEFEFYIDKPINEILDEVSKLIYSRSNYTINSKFKFGLENGTIIDKNQTVGELYKQYKNKNDNVLYLLITTENTFYEYLLSIFNSIYNTIFTRKSSKKFYHEIP